MQAPQAVDTTVKAGRFLYPVIEAVVLLLLSFSPWAFASVHPFFEFVLDAGVALLLVLWGATMLLNGELSWQRCPVALGLAALILVGVWQLAPLPLWLVQGVSPGTTATVAQLQPTRPEQLKADETAPVGGWPAGATISLYPGATRLAVLRLLAVFALFGVVRNTIASAGALRRLSVVALVNGVALALFALLQCFTSPRFTVYWTYPTDGDVFGPFICRNHFAFYVNVCCGLGLGWLLATLRVGRGFRLLDRSRALWVMAGLAILVSAGVFSLSRGGVVALASGIALGLAVLWATSARAPGVAVWLLTGALACGLVAWYGWPKVEARLNSLGPSAAKEGRWQAWSNGLAVWQQYPLFGTGYGTFRHVEPLQRRPGDDPDLDHEYAHNDYLEAAVEGGAVQLAISLVIIALVYRLGFRAYQRQKGRATGGLVLGGLVAFTTVVIHSFVDFGLHLPAIAFFVTVLCAHLAALGARPGEPAEKAFTVRRFGVGPLVGLGVTALLAVVLAGEGWKLSQAERFRLAARNLGLKEDAAATRDRRIAYLDVATSFEPADAVLQVTLAETHFQAWEASAGTERDHALQATRHYLLARGLCPLLPQPHVRLAALAGWLDAADPAVAYLRRATRVRPADAHLWYLCGRHELLDNDAQAACRCWRQSLAGSDKYLADMLHCGATALTAEQWTRDLLPDRPGGLKATDYHRRATVEAAIGQSSDAVASYRLALARDSRQAAWRLEMVELLIRQQQLDEALENLAKVPRESKGYADAQDALSAALEKKTP